jgi:hypothetical protein
LQATFLSFGIVQSYPPYALSKTLGYMSAGDHTVKGDGETLIPTSEMFIHRRALRIGLTEMSNDSPKDVDSHTLSSSTPTRGQCSVAIIARAINSECSRVAMHDMFTRTRMDNSYQTFNRYFLPAGVLTATYGTASSKACATSVIRPFSSSRPHGLCQLPPGHMKDHRR